MLRRHPEDRLRVSAAAVGAEDATLVDAAAMDDMIVDLKNGETDAIAYAELLCAEVQRGACRGAIARAGGALGLPPAG